MDSPVIVLSAEQIRQKTERLAHQINELHHAEEEIIILGIAKKGYEFAERLHQVLSGVFENKAVLGSIALHPGHPFQQDCTYSINPDDMLNKTVILIDDVLNSGKTLIYACKHILEHQPKRVNTVVLVDRRHRRFPIRADLVGLTLSTTMEEHITVDMQKNEAYLS